MGLLLLPPGVLFSVRQPIPSASWPLARGSSPNAVPLPADSGRILRYHSECDGIPCIDVERTVIEIGPRRLQCERLVCPEAGV